MIEIVRDEAVTARLIAAGHTPPPYVGQRWKDLSITGLPAGNTHVVTIVRLYPLISGWEAAVVRRHVAFTGEIIEDGCGEGVIYVSRLLEEFEALPDLHVLDVSEGEHGRRHYRIECPGVTPACRSYVENACPPGCRVQKLGEDTEEYDDGEAYGHGVHHRLFTGAWMSGTDDCFYVQHPWVPDVASDLCEADGTKLAPGRYRVALRCDSPGEELQITVSA